MNHVCIAVYSWKYLEWDVAVKSALIVISVDLKIFTLVIEWWNCGTDESVPKTRDGVECFFIPATLFLNKLIFTNKNLLKYQPSFDFFVVKIILSRFHVSLSTCCRWALIVYYVRHSALEAIFLIHLFMKHKQQRLIKLTTSKIHQSSKNMFQM
jgi:hypothetical protein